MDDNTLLHRQIHPNFVQNKTVSVQAFLEKNNIGSIAFTPNEKDDKKLSVYNGEKFTPEESYTHYTQQLKSFGTLSVSVKECQSINPLTVTEDNDPFDGHAFVDFTNVEGKLKDKAGKLRDFAVERGWKYLPK